MKKLLSFLPILMILLLISVLVIPASASETKIIKVACVGDSITDGGEDFSEYPANLQKFLDASKYEVKNFGFGGTTAMKKPNVVPSYWDKQHFTDSKNYQPDIVILMLGTNDVVNENWDPDTFKTDLTALVNVYLNLASHPTVYLCTPPAAFDSSHPALLRDYGVPIVKEVAQDTGATLVDVNSLTADFNEKGLSADGIHPNKKGYVRLAQIFYENIFGGESVEMTVKGEQCQRIVFAGQNPLIGSNGTVTVTTGNGLKNFKVEKSGVGYAIVNATVEGNTLVDLTGIEIPDNIAFRATATDKSGTVTSVNDGSSTTGWQREANEDYSNVWLQYDFGDNEEIAGMEIEWEDNSRPPEGKYKLTYSTNGTTWKNFTNLTIDYTNLIDTITFDTVSARYLKLDIQDGINGKYRPKVYEWRVTGETEPFKPAVTVHYGEESEDESLEIIGANLSLASDITVRYYISKELIQTNGYTDLSVRFELNGRISTVKEYTESNDYCIFSFTKIAPNEMNDTITATPCGKIDGNAVAGKKNTYSVAQYCKNQLSKTDSTKFKKLIYSLLNYGAASQAFVGNTGTPVNSFLTDAQKTVAEREYVSVMDITSELDNEPVTISGVGLQLNKSIDINVFFKASSVSNVKIVVTKDGETVDTVSSFTKSGAYYVAKFNKLNPSLLSDTYKFAAYTDGVQTSETLTYSVETYASRNVANPDSTQELIALVKAMMAYGDAVKEYVTPETLQEMTVFAEYSEKDGFAGRKVVNGRGINEYVYVAYPNANEFCWYDYVVVEYYEKNLKNENISIYVDEYYSINCAQIITEAERCYIDTSYPVADKPIIYLYPETDTVCSVSLNLNGKLTCTYPEYKEDGWSGFTAKPDGTLIFPDGSEYYALYWEGVSNTEFDMSKGFCVKGSDTAAFLADILPKLGLTAREANEFIIYWLPRMQNNAYNLISFQSEAYTENAKLMIDPKPDTLIRVFMAYQPLDEEVEVSPQEIVTPERIGFTVVEWGGSEVIK